MPFRTDAGLDPKMTRRLLLVSAVALLLSACASTPYKSLSEAGTGQRVVVIGAVDAILYLQSRGVQEAALGRDTMRVDRWGLHDIVANEVAAILRARGFSEVRVQNSLGLRQELRFIDSYQRLNAAQTESQQDRLSRLASRMSADVLVIATAGEVGDVFFGTGESVTGFGVYQYSAPSGLRSVNFSALQITMFDASAHELGHALGFEGAVREDADWLRVLQLSEAQLEVMQPVIASQHRTLAKRLMQDLGF